MSFAVINSTKNLQVSTLRSSSLTASSLTADVVVGSFSNGGLTTKTVVGYANPLSFPDALENSVNVLLSAADIPVQLPAGAIIRSLLVDNNGTPIVGGISFNVVTGLVGGSVEKTILEGFVTADVNAVAIADLPTYTPAAAIVIPVVATPADNYLSVTVIGGDNTAGSMRVFVTYSIIE